MTNRLRRGLALLGLGLLVALAGVGPLRAAPFLEIVVTGEDRTVTLDRAEFAALPRSSVVTSTPWTEGDSRFDGVLLRDLLAHLGLPAGDVVARALNDYEAAIPAADIAGYDVLVADRLDGKAMAIREKGPLWIIYPLDAHPELEGPDTEAKMVWQLSRLTVR